MKTITPTELQANTYAILDEILLTNMLVAVNIKDKRLLIVPVKQGHKLQNLPCCGAVFVLAGAGLPDRAPLFRQTVPGCLQ